MPRPATLTADEARAWDASDRVRTVALPRARSLHPIVLSLRDALEADDAEALAAAASELCRRAVSHLRAPPLRLEILEVRPRDPGGELHGLYSHLGDGPATVRVWMRTARRGRVVAFRTFLRTLAHELCHHLDVTQLGLASSPHSDGFFARESSLYQQLLPPELRQERSSSAPR